MPGQPGHRGSCQHAVSGSTLTGAAPQLHALRHRTSSHASAQRAPARRNVTAHSAANEQQLACSCALRPQLAPASTRLLRCVPTRQAALRADAWLRHSACRSRRNRACVRTDRTATAPLTAEAATGEGCEQPAQLHQQASTRGAAPVQGRQAQRCQHGECAQSEVRRLKACSTAASLQAPPALQRSSRECHVSRAEQQAQQHAPPRAHGCTLRDASRTRQLPAAAARQLAAPAASTAAAAAARQRERRAAAAATT
jgi:hypothetical protein